jgi:hypothetical protein
LGLQPLGPSLFDKAWNVLFGIAVRVTCRCIFPYFGQLPTWVPSIVDAKSFAKKFAHGATLLLGEPFSFFCEIRRKADGKDARDASLSHL